MKNCYICGLILIVTIFSCQQLLVLDLERHPSGKITIERVVSEDKSKTIMTVRDGKGIVINVYEYTGSIYLDDNEVTIKALKNITTKNLNASNNFGTLKKGDNPAVTYIILERKDQLNNDNATTSVTSLLTDLSSVFAAVVVSPMSLMEIYRIGMCLKLPI